MAFKDKIIGIILIVLGALPFLLKIEAITNALGKFEYALPGGYLYQATLIILGLFLLIRIRHRIEVGPRKY